MRRDFAVLGSVALALGTVMAAPNARACGGCLVPAENTSVVTDHRMLLALSKTETTLFDQIVYSGEPASFAWVLPINGEAEVGVSDEALFNVVDAATAVRILPPPAGCPNGPPKDRGCDVPQSAGPTPNDPVAVDVLARETVGPYETVQLRSTDAGALERWLARNGFVSPEAVRPVIGAYVRERFDFLALKLVPGKGVKAMRPVRVTWPGASASLPLRMIAAGTGAVVGVSLWVIAEGRYEPQNFPWFTIDAKDLVWEWSAQASNYKDLRARKTTELGGRGWQVESVGPIDQGTLRSSLMGGGPVGVDAGTYQPADGRTADEVAGADLRKIFGSLPIAGQTIVTRLRADLSRVALDADLVLTASGDQGGIPRIHRAPAENGQPLCIVYDGCTPAGFAPRDEAFARQDDHESFACAQTPSRRTSLSWAIAGAMAGLLAVVLTGARERRARRARERS